MTNTEQQAAFATSIQTMLNQARVINNFENPQNIADAFIAEGIQSRDQYLAWVAEYKRLINAAADQQKHLRKHRKLEQDGYPSAGYRLRNKTSITAMIELRRKSKIAARTIVQHQRAAEAA